MICIFEFPSETLPIGADTADVLDLVEGWHREGQVLVVVGEDVADPKQLILLDLIIK
jgi:hypothetical protein